MTPDQSRQIQLLRCLYMDIGRKSFTCDDSKICVTKPSADNVTRISELGTGSICAFLPVLPRFFEHVRKTLSTRLGSQTSRSLDRAEGYTEYSKQSVTSQKDHHIMLEGLPRDEKHERSVEGHEVSGSERTSRELIEERGRV